jgi:hypothetical protein
MMGALEKLYHQPSLFAYSLLKAYEVAVSPIQKGHKKSAVLPTLPLARSYCAFSIRLSRFFIGQSVRPSMDSLLQV